MYSTEGAAFHGIWIPASCRDNSREHEHSSRVKSKPRSKNVDFYFSMSGKIYMRKVSLFILSIIVAMFLVACASVGGQFRTVYDTTIEADTRISSKQGYPDNVLRVATLNIAHGRKDNFSQFFLKGSTIQKNLDDIADVLNKYKPQIVAFQEADAAESFNHVKYLASQSQYPWRAQVSNVDFLFLSYGTALLSALPLTESIKHTFAPSPPTFSKGFVLAQLEWPFSDKNTARKIDIISVHLDFSRKSVREQQIKDMIDILSARMNPMIVMGDFNSEWLRDKSVIKKLSTTSRFVAYKPQTSAYNTYKNKRLDWILITKELEFRDYKVLPDTLSDHAMVIAEIRFKDDPIFLGLK
jgi:endonuclease/exonuclease/phosphatase family metal-dependent hydrolase